MYGSKLVSQRWHLTGEVVGQAWLLDKQEGTLIWAWPSDRNPAKKVATFPTKEGTKEKPERGVELLKLHVRGTPCSSVSCFALIVPVWRGGCDGSQVGRSTFLAQVDQLKVIHHSNGAMCCPGQAPGLCAVSGAHRMTSQEVPLPIHTAPAVAATAPLQRSDGTAAPGTSHVGHRQEPADS